MKFDFKNNILIPRIRNSLGKFTNNYSDDNKVVKYYLWRARIPIQRNSIENSCSFINQDYKISNSYILDLTLGLNLYQKRKFYWNYRKDNIIMMFSKKIFKKLLCFSVGLLVLSNPEKMLLHQICKFVLLCTFISLSNTQEFWFIQWGEFKSRYKTKTEETTS